MKPAKRNRLNFFWLAACCALLLLSSCNTMKRLEPGKELYTGAKVDVQTAERRDRKTAAKELKKVLRPKPNQTVMGIRFKLWLYQVTGEDPKRKFRRWLKYKLGEKPVYYDPQIPVQVSDIMVNRLHNIGFFNASVSYSVVTTERKVSIRYEARVDRPYTIAAISFPDESGLLGVFLREAAPGRALKVGDQYRLELLKEERVRLDRHLKDRGYYFFNPDYLVFTADSTAGKRSIKLSLRVKEDAPLKARQRYRIGRVYVFASHRLRDTGRVVKGDTVMINGYHYVTRDSSLAPRAVLRSLTFGPGDMYSRKAHSTSVNRLMGMGVFHYVNVRFEDTLIDGEPRLNTFIYLTPMQKRSLQLELQAVTKSNNYAGPAVNVSYRNRNQFRHAELFVLNLNGNYETQFTGIQKGFNSYELGASTQLSLPRFVAPVKIRNVSSTLIPRTKVDAGFRNLNRVLYFHMNAANLSYGYTWKESARKEHELNPVAINFARVTRSTAAFQELLVNIPFLRRSFEEQFTIGGNYAFTYNSLVNNERSNQYYFNGMLDVSGNALSLAQSVIEGRQPSEENPFRLFGYRYSQFAKIATDGRYYHVINRNSKIATRLIAGVGFPYMNSRSLPYIKQFFSGGSNSIRAFLPRTVGPGTYISPDSASRRGFLDQAGDVKLEANVEYRFTMISVLKGALFLDAGNVWLLRKNPEQPGGEFIPSEFYRQVAVGSGFGLRLDVTYFVLRFDFGFPLRKPYKPYGERWVIRHIDFGDRTWRRQNFVLNIAIGYPF
jgi:outer membrane protein insertion porin family